MTSCILEKQYLEHAIEQSQHPVQRNCIKYLEDYVGDRDNDNVCILSGLQQTGKTTMMFHCISNMGRDDLKKSVYFDAGYCKNTIEVKKILEDLRKSGYRYVFIDEITKIPDFVNYSRMYHGLFTKSGMKIILAGTDSLRFHLAINTDLYGKSIKISTTRIPFEEYSRLMGIKHIDQYLAFGGVLFKKNSDIGQALLSPNLEIIQIPKFLRQLGKRYIDIAVAHNIRNALLHDKSKIFSCLETVAKDMGFIPAIYRMVLKDTKEYVLETLLEDFKADDFIQTAENLSSSFVIDKKDIDRISKAYAKALDIQKHRKKIPDNKFLIELKKFMGDIDFVKHYKQIGIGEIKEKIIFSQPYLRWNLLLELVDILKDDQQFEISYSHDRREKIYSNIFSSVQGKMLEDIVMLETIEKMPNFMSVFKFKTSSGVKGEYDLVVRNIKTGISDLIEVKHSIWNDKRHERHLANEKLSHIFLERFGGEIRNKIVLYAGKPKKQQNGIIRLNIHDWLKNDPIYILDMTNNISSDLTAGEFKLPGLL